MVIEATESRRVGGFGKEDDVIVPPLEEKRQWFMVRGSCDIKPNYAIWNQYRLNGLEVIPTESGSGEIPDFQFS